MWLDKSQMHGSSSAAKVLLVLLAMNCAGLSESVATAQSLSPNLLPPGAPLPGEATSAPARYATRDISASVRQGTPSENPANYPPSSDQYFQPGRAGFQPSADQQAPVQNATVPSRYATQFPSPANQEQYPSEQQLAAQRYADQQQLPQPLAADLANSAEFSKLPPYQRRELEHQRAYEQHLKRQPSDSTTTTTAGMPPAAPSNYNPALANQANSAQPENWSRQVPTGATVCVSSANHSGGARYHQTQSTPPGSAPQTDTGLTLESQNQEPIRHVERTARPIENWSQTQTTTPSPAARYEQPVKQGVPTTSPAESVIKRTPKEGQPSSLSGKKSNSAETFAESQVLQARAEVAAGEAALASTSEEASLIADLQSQVAVRTKELESNSTLDEQVKTDALAALKSAGEWLTRITQWERKTAEFKAEAEAVPQEIVKAKGLLEQPAEATKPLYAADAGLVNLEQLLAEAEATLKQNKTLFEEQDNQVKQRSERKAAIGKQLEQLDIRVDEIQKAMKAGGAERLPAEVAQAQQIELKTRDLASRAERQLLEAESLRHEAVTELLPLQRDLAQRAVKQQELLVNAWREEVAAFRKRESERQAREARERVEGAHPALKALAENNASLAERRKELARKIELIHSDLESNNTTLKDIDLNYKGITEKVKVGGLSSTVGMLLRKQRGELPSLTFHRDRLKGIEVELPQVQLASLELEEEREAIADLDPAVELVVKELSGVEHQFQPAELKRIVHEFLETKKKYLDDLLNDNDAYQDALGELDIVTRKLIGKTTEFCNYIDKHVLWIRSADPIATADLKQSASAAATIVSTRTVADLLAAVGQTFTSHPIQWLVTIVGFVSLRLAASRIRSRLSDRLQDVRKVGFLACFAPVWASLGLTLFNAMMWPALTWLVGWQLAAVHSDSEIVPALAEGLMTMSLLGIALEIVRYACMPHGLAENYLEWRAEPLQLLRQKLRWQMILGLPAVFLVVVIENVREGAWNDSAGRLVFVAGMGLLAFLLHGLLRPSASTWHKSSVVAGNLVYRLRHVWYFIALAAPLGLAWLAATGYYYSARELAVRLKMSFWLLVATVMVTSLLTRMLMMVAQNISRHKRHSHEEHAIEEHGESLVEAHDLAAETLQIPSVQPLATNTVTIETVSTPIESEHEDDGIDVHNVRAQVTRMVQGVALLSFLLVSWNIWAEVLPAFRVLDKVELWTSVREVMENVTDPDGNVTVTMVKQPVPTTLTHLILALAIFQITLLAGKNLPGLLEIAVLNRLPIDRGGRYAVSVICRYALTVTGFIFGFRMLGLTWNSVQWLIAAMTVGLGFGLQEIFANFVSGMIILFERPVRVGDLVTIGGMTGTVARVQIRATTITDADRRELIIPNKNFITGELINWTLTDTISRVVIPIGVAYGTDIELTQRTLLNVAESHPEVLKEPAPSAMFVSFGDSTLNFELRFFLGSRDAYAQVLHELNTAIDQKFRAARIEIAFPQQELTIKSIDSILPYLREQSSAVQLPATAAMQRAA